MKTSFEKVLHEVIAAERITESARRLVNQALNAYSNSREKKDLYKWFMEPLKSICIQLWDPFFPPGSIETIKDDNYGPDFRYHYRRETGISIKLDWKLFVTTFNDPLWSQFVSVDQYVSMSNKQFYRYMNEQPSEWIWLERNITNFDTSTFAGNRNAKAFSHANVEQRESWAYGGFRGDMLGNWQEGKDYFNSQLINGSREDVVVFRFDSLPFHQDLTNFIPEAREKGVLF